MLLARPRSPSPARSPSPSRALRSSSSPPPQSSSPSPTHANQPPPWKLGDITSPLTAAQDRNYWASSWEEGSELLTAWVALSDVGVESGPMTFVRGSNAWGLLEGCGFFHEQSLEEQKAACLAAAPPSFLDSSVTAGSGGGAISALRTFRLFRVLRLLSSVPSMVTLVAPEVGPEAGVIFSTIGVGYTVTLSRARVRTST